MYDTRQEANEFVGDSLAEARTKAAEFGRDGQSYLRADGSLPFATVLPVIRTLYAAGLPVCIALKPLDPSIRIETRLRLPLPTPDDSPIEVDLHRTGDTLQPDHTKVDGQSVRVHLPEDALLEETLHTLIRLKMAGATGFAFE